MFASINRFFFVCCAEEGNVLFVGGQVEDVARAFDTILHRGVIGKVYNIGGTHEKANVEVAKDLIRLMGLEKKEVRGSEIEELSRALGVAMEALKGCKGLDAGPPSALCAGRVSSSRTWRTAPSTTCATP
jgi:nucleoside-diphosphate-sugar epimerase